MPENKTTKQDLIHNKYGAVMAKWGLKGPEAEKRLIDFMSAMQRQRRTYPTPKGPRLMFIRDRQDHRTGKNIILVPEAEELAHALFLKYTQKESK